MSSSLSSRCTSCSQSFPHGRLRCHPYHVDTAGAVTMAAAPFTCKKLTIHSGSSATATATSQPASGGGLFGSTAAQPSQSGGLFGGSTQPATSQPASGGLFGNMNKPAATAPATGGLFGSSTAQPSAPASGGLFGGALGASTQPAAAPSGGLFGGAQPAKPSLLCVNRSIMST